METERNKKKRKIFNNAVLIPLCTRTARFYLILVSASLNCLPLFVLRMSRIIISLETLPSFETNFLLFVWIAFVYPI